MMSSEHRQRLSVLQVIESAAAGSGRYVLDLTTHLDTEAFDVTLAYSPLRMDDMWRAGLEQVRSRGIKLQEIYMERQPNPGSDTAALRKLVELVQSNKFDLVHGHSSKAGFLSRIAARVARTGTRTVYSPHAISISINKAYWALEKIASLATDVILAVSRSEYAELKRYRLVPDRKLRFIKAAVDVAGLQIAGCNPPSLPFPSVPENHVLIGSVGRLAPQKDPVNLVRAASILRTKGLPVSFIWAGTGELKDQVEAEIRELALDADFHLLGYRSDVPQLLSALDIFALPSAYESFGYVTCEAMALAKPIVGTNVTGTSELVQDGETGFLVPSGDPKALAAALEPLVRDAALRTRMGANGCERARNEYDLPRMVGQIEQMYRELCARSATGRSVRT